MINKSKNIFIVDFTIISFASLAIFFPSLNIYFLSENISHIIKVLKNISYSDYYRPVFDISLIVDHFLWSFNYTGYHFSNLIFHTINTLFVYYLANMFFENRIYSLFAGFLFLLHPIHHQNIFWIDGRTDMLCFLFYLPSLVLFLKSYHKSNQTLYILSCVFFILAIAAKEMALSLPLVLGSYILIVEKKPFKKTLLIIWKKTWPYFSLAIATQIIKFFVKGGMVFANPMHRNINPVHLIKNFTSYIGLLIIPGGHITIAEFLKQNPYVFIGLAILGIVALLFALKWIVKYPELLFFTFFVILSLLPVIRLMMRWYLYIPSVGFVLALSFIIKNIFSNNYQVRRKFAYLTMILILVVYTGIIRSEQNKWVQTGKVSKKLTGQIAQIIKEKNVREILFLNVPAEVEEIALFIYGFESLLKYRLVNDFDYLNDFKIHIISYISLNTMDDLTKCKVEFNRNKTITVSLADTRSFFIFPNNPDIETKLSRPEPGTELFYEKAQVTVKKLSAANEVNKLSINIKNENLPILYIQSGKIHFLSSMSSLISH